MIPFFLFYTFDVSSLHIKHNIFSFVKKIIENLFYNILKKEFIAIILVKIFTNSL